MLSRCYNAARISNSPGESCLVTYRECSIFLPLSTNKTLKIPTCHVLPRYKPRYQQRAVAAPKVIFRTTVIWHFWTGEREVGEDFKPGSDEQVGQEQERPSLGCHERCWVPPLHFIRSSVVWEPTGLTQLPTIVQTQCLLLSTVPTYAKCHSSTLFCSAAKWEHYHCKGCGDN